MPLVQAALAGGQPAACDVVGHAHHRRGRARSSWLAVTFITAPEPDAKLDSFYQRVRPGGPGWRAVSERLGYGGETIPGGALAWTNWLAGIVAVYASLFGIGKLIFGELGSGHHAARDRGGGVRLDRAGRSARSRMRARERARVGDRRSGDERRTGTGRPDGIDRGST